MSDQIKHECGIAMVRLLKPMEYYHKKYGSVLYGLNKMHIMMQKQRNRGQDGAGLASVQLNTDPGSRYISRKRSIAADPIKDVFDKVYGYFEHLDEEKLQDTAWLQENIPFLGEVILGHLRYGTHGRNSEENCHPVLRQNNWKTRNLLLAGNFNLTNVDELFGHLVELGQHPKEKSDTVTVLEKIGHFLDQEVQRLFDWHKSDYNSNFEITERIIRDLDIQRILERATRKFDGGYVMGGLLGHGDAFVMRDPSGIRPAYYYLDNEVVVVASERPAIQTAFNVAFEDVHELTPGHALIIKADGRVSEEQYIEPKAKTSCSFERIYFSRMNDAEIYHERKKLGENLADAVLKAINHDLENTVFSFVPNSAEISFFGLIKGIENRLDDIHNQQIMKLQADNELTLEKLKNIKKTTPRVEKIITKDVKLRTFITEDSSRDQLVAGAYDITYGVIRKNIDTLVLMDDSIVRGTTLRENLIRMVARLEPKKIIIVSSAPQIRYPDCYGIDMSKMKNFVAFRALVELLEEQNKMHLLEEAYERASNHDYEEELVPNELAPLYALFSQREISKKIAQIVTPEDIEPAVEIIYQTIEGLHDACPNHTGDWYFTGNFPTKGGRKVVNKAFINYVEQKDVRAYW